MNRFNEKITVAMMFLVISMTIYFLIDLLPYEIILIGCAFQGIGNGLFSAPNNKYVLTIVDEDDLADASSILSSSKEYGKILSTGIFTLILSLFIGNQSLGPEHLDLLLIQSSNLMMFICILLTLSATVLLLYSLYGYEPGVNERVVEIFKSIEPEYIRKKRNK